MIWDDFYDRYANWSDTTVKSRISSLESIGSGEDVVDVVLNLFDDKLRVQLICKAMKLGVLFFHDDLMLLDGEIPRDVYEEVVRYSGFCVDAPEFDENDFTWDDFYAVCTELPSDMLGRCIPRIREFGDRDEVVSAVTSLYDDEIADALYARAVACGVKFTKRDLEEMGREDSYTFLADDVKAFCDSIDLSKEQISENIRQAEMYADEQLDHQKNVAGDKKKRRKLFGSKMFGGFVLGVKIGVLGNKKTKGTRRGTCSGNCAKCPAHFGYRYGRWYYGHGHNYGCEFGGNKGGDSQN